MRSDRSPVEARRNTLFGQGFHLPFTIVLFTIIALEVLGTSPTLRTDVSYGPAELFLRRCMHGTVFQPDAFLSFPGLITARDFVEDSSGIVRCDEDVLWLRNPGSESLVSESLESVATSLLQSPFDFVSYVDTDTEFVAISLAILRPYGILFGAFRMCSFQWLPYKPLVFPARNPISRASLERERFRANARIRQASGVPRPSAWTWRASSSQLAKTPTRCAVL